MKNVVIFVVEQSKVNAPVLQMAIMIIFLKKKNQIIYLMNVKGSLLLILKDIKK